MSKDLTSAKEKLDSLIHKQRIALYKPIQIAEILYRVRIGELSVLDVRRNLEKYRNPSKRWRDEVTKELINQISTSSQKYQDNLFEPNAMPPEAIAVLAEHNKKFEGVVERYIYQKFKEQQKTILRLSKLLEKASPDKFQLPDFLAEFIQTKGIKRSVDKAFEIVVYALFDILVKNLQVTITIRADSSKLELLREFEDFSRTVLGIDTRKQSVTIPAQLYRAGVANAADRGLDMWGNFGPAIQVKHLTLTEDLAEDICDEIVANRIVIICKDSEEETIKRIFQQVGLSNRIQGIITQKDLVKWYDLALRGKFASLLGKELLSCLRTEFSNEFPYSTTFDSFYYGRKYDAIPKTSSIFWWGDLNAD